MNTSFFQELLNSISERGRQLLPRSLGGAEPKDDITGFADALVSARGASGVAIAAKTSIATGPHRRRSATTSRFLAERRSLIRTA